MTRTLGVALVLFVAITMSGCGFLISKLPRVHLEPPPSEKTEEAQKTSEAPFTTEETRVIEGTLPKPAGGGSSGGGTRVRYVPVGSQRTLTTSDLSGLSKWQLDVLRNEIYAAHGRRFDRSDLRNHFERQTWYQPDSGFTESRLSSLEKRNAAFIADYQKRRGQVSGSSSSTRTSSSRRSSGGQVLPFSSSRSLSYSDLAGLSSWQLDVARNEIYARHGRPFKRSDLRAHFRSQGWYSEDSSFTESRLSSLEKRNAEFIRQYQR